MPGTNVITEPLVAIIIPCHLRTLQEAALLDETLRSVDAQSCTHYELIVIDDGSPVEVKGAVDIRPGTRLLHQAQAGPAAARNAGIAASRAPYLVFLDADDHLLPGGLETALAAFASHPECGFVVGPREEMTFEGEPVSWPVPVPPVQTDLYNSLLGFDWYIIPPSSTMFRRQAVESVGGFRDPWGADDLDFYLRVARRFTAWCY